MARNYPVWARSLVDPESFENEQRRLGQVWTLVGVPTQGIVPDPFREGQGVVAEGKLEPGDTLAADTVLAKHDERYMPREVVDALKKAGRWQEGEGKTSR
jgi:cytochrome c-type biogenesis protein CcmE